MGEILKTLRNSKTGEEYQYYIKTSDLLNRNGYLFKKDADTIRIFNDASFIYNGKTRKSIFDGLSKVEKGHLLDLIQLTGRSNYIVKSLRYSKEKIAKEDEILKYLGFSKRYGKLFLKKLVNLNILRKTKEGYNVNPLIVCRNYRIEVECYKIWRDLLKNNIPTWAVIELDSLVEELGED